MRRAERSASSERHMPPSNNTLEPAAWARRPIAGVSGPRLSVSVRERTRVKPGMAALDVTVIEAELASFKRWQAAYARCEDPLPELPGRDDQRGSIETAVGVAAHLGLAGIGWWAGRLGLGGLRVWAAREEIAIDRFWYEPASCGLNHAYTRLGLALLAGGDESGAINCPQAGWRIHPCPHNTSFGLDPRLWSALVGVSAADYAREEYAEVARKFSPDGGWPPPKVSLRRVFRSLWSSLSNPALQRTRPSGRAAERHRR